MMMRYRRFGKLDWQVSALGFGCMRLPVVGGDNTVIDEPLAERMVRRAIDQGVNYVDTAYGYHGGNSERLLGKVLQDGYRQKIRLATKMPSWLINTYEDFDRCFNEQLERLQTDRVDFYLLHALNKSRWATLREVGVRDWLDKAIKDGRVGAAGFSFHDEYPYFKQIIDEYTGWSFCQIQYNYIDLTEQAGTEGLKYAAGKGLAVVVMEPLLGGWLANPPEVLQDIFKGHNSQRTPVDWSLQWLWNLPEVSVVLSGMSLPEQVEENLVSAGLSGVGSLTPGEEQVYDLVRKQYRESTPIPCTQCGYCQPCPNGVNIPRIFEFFNKGVAINNFGQARFRYTSMPEGEKADQCVDCLECESKCPQHIHITAWLDYVHDILVNEKPFVKSEMENI
jgi:uncharacterized protein